MPQKKIMNYYKNNKYFNKKIKTQEGTFDSKKELARYNELLILVRTGQIDKLQRQVKFEIVPKDGNERAAYYVADFVYIRADGKKIIEDVKSEMTKKLPLYILKRKLVKHLYKDYLFIES